MTAPGDTYKPVYAELAHLRYQVPGVLGCVVAGVDGLLILHDQTTGPEPHDVAALAAGAHGISRTTGSQYREYDAIDLALRTGKKPVIFQKEYDIAQHLPLAQKIPEQAVAEMLHYVGDAADIKNIILVGGGAFFYRKALKTAFPHHELQELKDPIFANVKGFQFAGTELAKQVDAASARTDGTEPLDTAT